MDLASLHPPPALSGDGLALEPLQVEHAREMAAVLDDVGLHTWTGGAPAAVEQLRTRYERQVRGRSEDGRQVWLNWVVRAITSGAALGYVQATVDVGDPAIGASSDAGGAATAHLAWVVGVPHQDAGVARRAAGPMVGWLRSRGEDRWTTG